MQIQVQQVRAPDLSGTSRILANANTALQSGLGSASDLLATYSAGQQERNDLEVTTALASISNEQDLDKYLRSGALAGKNISPALQGDILGFRDTLLGQNQQRATTIGADASTALTNEQIITEGSRRSGLEARTRSIDASTAIKNAAEGRAAELFGDDIDRRDFNRGRAGDFLDSSLTARGATAKVEDRTRNAAPFNPNSELSTARAAAQANPSKQLTTSKQRAASGQPVAQLNAQSPTYQDDIFSGLKERGLPDHVAQGFLSNFRDESGFDPSANEANPTVLGSRGGFGIYQTTGPRRVALERFAEAEGKPVGDTNLQLDNLINELGGTESAAYKKILATNTPEEAASVIAETFLRPSATNLAERQAQYDSGDIWRPSSGGAAPQVAQTQNVQTPQPAPEPAPQSATQLLQAATAPAQAPLSVEDQVEQQAQSIMALYAQSGQFTPEEVLAKGEAVRQQFRQQQGIATSEANALQADQLLGRQIAASQNPHLLTQDDRNQALLNDRRITSNADVLAAIAQSTALNAQGGVLNAISNPGTPANPDLDVARESYQQRLATARAGNSQGRALSNAGTFADDPVNAVIQELGLSDNDGETRNFNKTKEFIRTRIQDLAEENQVPEKFAAYALTQIFKQDPLGLNNKSRRFDKTAANNYIRENFNAESVRNFQENELQQKVLDSRYSIANNSFKTLTQQATKQRRNNEQVSPDILANLERLRAEILTIESRSKILNDSPVAPTAPTSQGFDPNSASGILRNTASGIG